MWVSTNLHHIIDSLSIDAIQSKNCADLKSVIFIAPNHFSKIHSASLKNRNIGYENISPLKSVVSYS